MSEARWKRWKIAGLIAALLGATTVAACHHGGVGWHARHHAMQGEMTPEEASKRVDKMVNWVLDDVDATPAQKQKVSGIAKDALKDLIPLRQQHHQARERAITLLTQADIDRAALEALRAQELELAQTASRRLTQALADMAEVMTVQQRQELARELRKRWG